MCVVAVSAAVTNAHGQGMQRHTNVYAPCEWESPTRGSVCVAYSCVLCVVHLWCLRSINEMHSVDGLKIIDNDAPKWTFQMHFPCVFVCAFDTVEIPNRKISCVGLFWCGTSLFSLVFILCFELLLLLFFMNLSHSNDRARLVDVA